MLIMWESRFLSFKEQGREWILFSCFRLHFSVDGFVFAAKNVLVDTEWGEIIVLLFHWKIRIHHVFSFPLLKTLQILDKTFCSYLLEKHFLEDYSLFCVAMIVTFCFTLLWHLQMDVSWSLHGDELFPWYNFSSDYMVLLLCYHVLIKIDNNQGKKS